MTRPPSEWVRRRKRTVLVAVADCAFLRTVRLGTVVCWRYGMSLPLESIREVQGALIGAGVMRGARNCGSLADLLGLDFGAMGIGVEVSSASILVSGSGNVKVERPL